MALTAQIALGCHLPSREQIYSNFRVNKERIRLKTSVTHFKAGPARELVQDLV